MEYPVAVKKEIRMVEELSHMDDSTIPHKRMGSYKAIMNRDNLNQVYSIVSNEYHIIQHEEVVGATNKALDDLKLVGQGDPYLGYEGARLYISKHFAGNQGVDQTDIGFMIDGEYIGLVITIANSYDCSCGLECTVRAYKASSGVQLYITERFAHVRRKHTTHALVDVVTDAISKGVEVFQNKIKAWFEKMLNKVVDPLAVCIEMQILLNDDKRDVAKYPKGYLENIIKAIELGRPTNAWRAYNLILETLANDPDLKSEDRRQQISNNFVNLLMKVA